MGGLTSPDTREKPPLENHGVSHNPFRSVNAEKTGNGVSGGSCLQDGSKPYTGVLGASAIRSVLRGMSGKI